MTCPLCLRRSKYLTCCSCLRSGSVTHTGKRPESYCEKVKRLADLKHVKEAFQKRVTEEIANRQAVQQLNDAVILKREKISCIQSVIRLIQQHTSQDQQSLDSIRKSNAVKKVKLKSNADEIKTLLEVKKKHLATLSKRMRDLKSLQNELGQVRQRSMALVQKYLFPIQAIPVYPVMGTPPPPQHTPESLDLSRELSFEDQADASVESALAEATQTSYVQGKWVNETATLELSIIDSSLPWSGDYSAYRHWVKAHKNGSKGPDDDVGLRNPAYTISSALTHAAQLLELLASLLDVNLPSKLSYSEFCQNEMGRKEFQSALSRLNTNVLHLCFTQHVDPTLLHPHRTLNNLYALINTTCTGRGGPFEYHPELLSTDNESAEDRPSDFESSSEEDGDSDTEADWETLPKNVEIPDTPPFGGTNTSFTESITSRSMTSHSTSSSEHETDARQNETSMSLVSSAVSALWNWKNNRD
ncbi:predicted protein [Nematostella vectensis]|uniref:Beclin 1-associated autophagy-related key regulator n=2 Tax=Nematostella vectensis TaxID=45351 RepID=A7SI99_NEMVE|nr:predicted protein [Nematostella vectensis]|eukprot:XP_001628618.1 predicted protein [Nematostella vectensis]